MTRTDYSAAFADPDNQYLVRLLGRYTGDSLEVGCPLLPAAPVVLDPDWTTILAAATRWVASQTNGQTPAWAAEMQPAPQALFPSEKYRDISTGMRELIRIGTPPELARLNVWVRERDLLPVSWAAARYGARSDQPRPAGQGQGRPATGERT